MELIIKGVLIEAPIIEILEKCKSELTTNKLGNIVDKGDWVSVPCPFHSDGKEAHNSCGIVSDPNSTKEYGTWHCFTCGEKGNLAKFIAQCFNTDLNYGEQWLIKNFGRVLSQRVYNLSPIELKPKYRANNYLNESSLNYLQPYHPYMTERKLTREVIEKFKIKYDPSKKTIVFPVWDMSGNYLFNTERSVVGKTFYIPSGVQKPVYLLNYIMKNGIDTVIVVESQINALTCYGYGLNAVALFGTGDSFQYGLLNRSCIRHYYLAFDGDDAGYKAIARFKANIRKDVLVDIIKIPLGEDVNSLPKETFIKLFEESKNI